MRIVIDLQGVQNESRYRGIGRYSLAFVKALVKALIDRRAQHEVIVLLSDLFPDTIAPVKAALGEQLAGCSVRVWTMGASRLANPCGAGVSTTEA